MPEGFIDAPNGDEFDFRPSSIQPPQRKTAPQVRTVASDGIDFQPTAPTSRAQRLAARVSSDEIDFQPAEQPATFDTLYKTPQSTPTPSERAARVGDLSLAQPFAPKTFDLTEVPRSPFTNQLELSPAMRTEEEKRREGTIGPREVTVTDRLKRMLGSGAPEGSFAAEITGERGTKGQPRLLSPEELMTESEQLRHPILTGAGEFAGGFTTPEGLLLMGLTAGAGELAGPGAQTAKRLLAAGFTGSMLYGAAQKSPEVAAAFRRGDDYTAKRLLTQMGLEAVTAGFAARGTFEEGLPTELPKGTVSGPLAMDRLGASASRRFQDLRANDAARRGMANLADAERGIEVERQARINAPVEVPKTYEGQPPILSGRPQGPERNPLEVEAERVREQRAERERPDFRVMDLRRVVPKDSSQPPFYEIPSIESRPATPSVESAPAGETVGARGRSATMSDLAERMVPKIENSLAQKFSPDILEEARQEIQNAAGLAGSFERPGRYFAEYGPLEYMPSRSTNAAKGIHAGGVWYGVGSARDMISDMHPWYRDVLEGPETLSRLAQEQKGAAFDRILERVATHIQNERESARPVIEEFAPQLWDLAGRVREVDPDLAGTLQSLAEGKAVGFNNLRAYIQGVIHDAEGAALFSDAVDEAAGESTGVEETSRLAGEARPAETRRPESAAESTDSLDFQGFPEPQPINPQELEDISRQLGRPVTAEELPEIRRRLAAEQNIAEGLRGNRRDVAGEIREEHRAKLEQPKREPGDEIAERYSGVNPRALVEGAKVLQRAWTEKVAQPFIDKVLRIGDKYQKAREADPAVAEGLHLLDNAQQYLRAKAAQEVHNVIGNLSRAQERLFTLMADADSRENLRTNHPQEFAQAQRDPAIQDALRKYRPIEQELTRLRGQMGGEVLDHDYLRRVYDRHVAGINQREAPSSTGERATSAFDRVIRPQRIGNLSREATAEYHYQNGLHEFGPAFATKYIGTHLRALRDQVAKQFIDEATMLPAGASEPRFIMYRGERYYRPDVAREMRDAGQKNVKQYDRYDPTAGEKFPVPAEGKFLGPRELVKVLNDYGRNEEGQPGAVRRFFQEQILGFGFGVPHIANIMRRVSQNVPGGAANPKGWVEAWRVVLSKELRDRGIEGLNDPTFDMLAKHGAISTGEFANLKEYWGGNLNPANWARSLAQIGHEVLFNPQAAKGWGGLDQRARLYIADLVRSQRSDLTDAQVANAVRTQLGDYNRANWTDRQKMLSKFMMFPGWDFSSVKWVLQHPIKTTVPPALVVLLANQALHQLGQNRAEDATDISNIHVGDRAYGTSLLRESVARNLFRPAHAYAQAKIRGESDQRAMAQASRGVTSGAGGLLGMLRPDLSGFLAIATNRQALFGGKELVSRGDFSQPGKILPSRAVEKEAVFALRHAVPALDRMLDANEDFDLRSFAGGNLGVPNFRDDAEKRLLRNAAEAAEIHSNIQKLAKSNPELARQYVKDPDNAAFALFYHDLNGLSATLKRMNEAKERIERSGLSAEDKKARIATIDQARENLLQHADGLNNLLFERRQKGKPTAGLFDAGWMMRAVRSQPVPDAVR
jgi:hypothetical protein